MQSNLLRQMENRQKRVDKHDRRSFHRKIGSRHDPDSARENKRGRSPLRKPRGVFREHRRRQSSHSTTSGSSSSKEPEREHASDKGGHAGKKRNRSDRDQERRNPLGKRDLRSKLRRSVRKPGDVFQRLGASSWEASPFSKDIERSEPPKRYAPQQFKSYDGRADPKDHVIHFEQMMMLYRSENALMCKIFPTTFEGPALSWFSRLPSRSIYCWEQFVDIFTDRFITSSKRSRTLTDLFAMRKEPREGIREYAQRYFEMMNEVENCPPSVAVMSFKTGLPKSGELFRELAKRPPTSQSDLIRRIDEVARLEDELGTETHSCSDYLTYGGKSSSTGGSASESGQPFNTWT